MPVNIISTRGTSVAGEVWSTSIAFRQTDGTIVDDFAGLTVWASAVAGLWTQTEPIPEWRQPLTNAKSGLFQVTSIRAEARASSSELLQAAEIPVEEVAEGTSAKLPVQTAVVWSLLTGRPGRSYRGRVYWPAAGLSLDPATLRIDSDDVNSVSVAASQYITAVCAAAGTGTTQPCVWSRKLDSTLPVTDVSVGNVPDTQRRRRDRLQELRVNSVITQPV